MVKRYDVHEKTHEASWMEESVTGHVVMYVDHAALQASHTRLLNALNAFTGYVAADHNDTSLLDNDALWNQASEAIAAAQPFTEK